MLYKNIYIISFGLSFFLKKAYPKLYVFNISVSHGTTPEK